VGRRDVAALQRCGPARRRALQCRYCRVTVRGVLRADSRAMSLPQGESAPRLPSSLAIDDVALQLIDLALEEDRGAGDWTTRWTVPARTRAHASIIAKADGVIAGIALASAVFLRLEPRISLDVIAGDGEHVRRGDPVMRVRGPARSILTGERVALNFLQRLS